MPVAEPGAVPARLGVARVAMVSVGTDRITSSHPHTHTHTHNTRSRTHTHTHLWAVESCRHADVPLAHEVRAVACLLHLLGDASHVDRHPLITADGVFLVEYVHRGSVVGVKLNRLTAKVCLSAHSVGGCSGKL